MSSRAARHPAVLVPALIVIMFAGSVLVGSAVEYFAVGSSRLDLDSETGVGIAIGGSLLAMAAIAAILFLAFGADQGHGGGDEGHGGGGVPPLPPRDPFGEREPLWWPQFEQDLDAYLREPAGDRRGPERLPALH